MSTDERHISLRVKVPVQDGTAVVEMTGPAAPENGLQAFGDWVLAALEQHADGAAEAARLMIAALRERDWDGDDVLADQLDALQGSSARISALCRWIWMSWPASLRATRCTAAGASTWRLARSGRPLPSIRRGRSGKRMRTNRTILISGCGCTARVRGTATGTWSCSSGQCVIQGAPTGWRSPFPGEERSGGLRMCWRAGPENWIGGMRFPRSVSVAGPGPGWPTPVTTSAGLPPS